MRSGTLPRIRSWEWVSLPDRQEEMQTENERIRMLRDRLWNGLSQIEATYLNGDMTSGCP